MNELPRIIGDSPLAIYRREDYIVLPRGCRRFLYVRLRCSKCVIAYASDRAYDQVTRRGRGRAVVRGVRPVCSRKRVDHGQLVEDDLTMVHVFAVKDLAICD